MKTATEQERLRAAIIEEAKTWLGTPWHHEARVKGAGVDCGMFILGVCENLGLTPHVVPPHYGPDFMLHRSDEWYVEIILKFADEIFSEPYLPADAVVFKHGRIYSHGGIIVNWPLIIHASAPERCVLYGDASQSPISTWPRRIFRHKELL
jgi:cell wall-associated NlpC family hydrolase